MGSMSKAVLLFVGTFLLSGCITARSYVDPQYHLATYDTVHRLAAPIPVRVVAKFQVNGTDKPAVDGTLAGQVELALRASGVFAPTKDPTVPASITVTANDIADLAEARAKGFGTGLTFGAAGSVVPDNYEFSYTYNDGGKGHYEAVFRHAIYTTVGHASAPVKSEPTTPADAFNHVVQDVTLNFLQDMQDKGIVGQ